MAAYTFRALIDAPIDLVFDVLTDHRRYAEFTPLRSVTLEREGISSINGIGAVRALHLAGPVIREEVIEYVRPTRFAYRMLSGMPVRDHVGRVELLQEASGTRVVYQLETFPTVPAPFAPAVSAVARLAVGRLFKAIRTRAEQLASAAG